VPQIIGKSDSAQRGGSFSIAVEEARLQHRMFYADVRAVLRHTIKIRQAISDTFHRLVLEL
jgi:hypothetical protein